MAIVGVSDHAGWAVLVAVERGKLIGRRRISLVEDGVPVMPHHHDARALGPPWQKDHELAMAAAIAAARK